MTEAQTYTIKEMLAKEAINHTEQHDVINKKIDALHEVLTGDEGHTGRIGSLEKWQSGTMAVVKTFMWLVSGLGVGSVVLWLIFGID
jgi:hypothetical protein